MLVKYLRNLLISNFIFLQFYGVVLDLEEHYYVGNYDSEPITQSAADSEAIEYDYNSQVHTAKEKETHGEMVAEETKQLKTKLQYRNIENDHNSQVHTAKEKETQEEMVAEDTKKLKNKLQYTNNDYDYNSQVHTPKEKETHGEMVAEKTKQLKNKLQYRNIDYNSQVHTPKEKETHGEMVAEKTKQLKNKLQYTNNDYNSQVHTPKEKETHGEMVAEKTKQLKNKLQYTNNDYNSQVHTPKEKETHGEMVAEKTKQLKNKLQYTNNDYNSQVHTPKEKETHGEMVAEKTKQLKNKLQYTNNDYNSQVHTPKEKETHGEMVAEKTKQLKNKLQYTNNDYNSQVHTPKEKETHGGMVAEKTKQLKNKLQYTNNDYDYNSQVHTPKEKETHGEMVAEKTKQLKNKLQYTNNDYNSQVHTPKEKETHGEMVAEKTKQLKNKLQYTNNDYDYNSQVHTPKEKETHGEMVAEKTKQLKNKLQYRNIDYNSQVHTPKEKETHGEMVAKKTKQLKNKLQYRNIDYNSQVHTPKEKETHGEMVAEKTKQLKNKLQYTNNDYNSQVHTPKEKETHGEMVAEKTKQLKNKLLYTNNDYDYNSQVHTPKEKETHGEMVAEKTKQLKNKLQYRNIDYNSQVHTPKEKETHGEMVAEKTKQLKNKLQYRNIDYNSQVHTPKEKETHGEMVAEKTKQLKNKLQYRNIDYNSQVHTPKEKETHGEMVAEKTKQLKNKLQYRNIDYNSQVHTPKEKETHGELVAEETKQPENKLQYTNIDYDYNSLVHTAKEKETQEEMVAEDTKQLRNKLQYTDSSFNINSYESQALQANTDESEYEVNEREAAPYVSTHTASYTSTMDSSTLQDGKQTCLELIEHEDIDTIKASVETPTEQTFSFPEETSEFTPLTHSLSLNPTSTEVSTIEEEITNAEEANTQSFIKSSTEPHNTKTPEITSSVTSLMNSILRGEHLGKSYNDSQKTNNRKFYEELNLGSSPNYLEQSSYTGVENETINKSDDYLTSECLNVNKFTVTNNIETAYDGKMGPINKLLLPEQAPMPTSYIQLIKPQSELEKMEGSMSSKLPLQNLQTSTIERTTNKSGSSTLISSSKNPIAFCQPYIRPEIIDTEEVSTMDTTPFKVTTIPTLTITESESPEAIPTTESGTILLNAKTNKNETTNLEFQTKHFMDNNMTNKILVLESTEFANLLAENKSVNIPSNYIGKETLIPELLLPEQAPILTDQRTYTETPHYQISQNQEYMSIPFPQETQINKIPTTTIPTEKIWFNPTISTNTDHETEVTYNELTEAENESSPYPTLSPVRETFPTESEAVVTNPVCKTGDTYIKPTFPEILINTQEVKTGMDFHTTNDEILLFGTNKAEENIPYFNKPNKTTETIYEFENQTGSGLMQNLVKQTPFFSESYPQISKESTSSNKYTTPTSTEVNAHVTETENVSLLSDHTEKENQMSNLFITTSKKTLYTPSSYNHTTQMPESTYLILSSTEYQTRTMTPHVNNELFNSISSETIETVHNEYENQTSPLAFPEASETSSAFTQNYLKEISVLNESRSKILKGSTAAIVHSSVDKMKSKYTTEHVYFNKEKSSNLTENENFSVLLSNVEQKSSIKNVFLTENAPASKLQTFYVTSSYNQTTGVQKSTYPASSSTEYQTSMISRTVTPRTFTGSESFNSTTETLGTMHNEYEYPTSSLMFSEPSQTSSGIIQNNITQKPVLNYTCSKFLKESIVAVDYNSIDKMKSKYTTENISFSEISSSKFTESTGQMTESEDVSVPSDHIKQKSQTNLFLSENTSTSNLQVMHKQTTEMKESKYLALPSTEYQTSIIIGKITPNTYTNRELSNETEETIHNEYENQTGSTVFQEVSLTSSGVKENYTKQIQNLNYSYLKMSKESTAAMGYNSVDIVKSKYMTETVLFNSTLSTFEELAGHKTENENVSMPPDYTEQNRSINNLFSTANIETSKLLTIYVTTSPNHTRQVQESTYPVESSPENQTNITRMTTPSSYVNEELLNSMLSSTTIQNITLTEKEKTHDTSMGVSTTISLPPENVSKYVIKPIIPSSELIPTNISKVEVTKIKTEAGTVTENFLINKYVTTSQNQTKQVQETTYPTESSPENETNITRMTTPSSYINEELLNSTLSITTLQNITSTENEVTTTISLPPENVSNFVFTTITPSSELISTNTSKVEEVTNIETEAGPVTENFLINTSLISALPNYTEQKSSKNNLFSTANTETSNVQTVYITTSQNQTRQIQESTYAVESSPENQTNITRMTTPSSCVNEELLNSTLSATTVQNIMLTEKEETHDTSMGVSTTTSLPPENVSKYVFTPLTPSSELIPTNVSKVGEVTNIKTEAGSATENFLINKSLITAHILSEFTSPLTETVTPPLTFVQKMSTIKNVLLPEQAPLPTEQQLCTKSSEKLKNRAKNQKSTFLVLLTENQPVIRSTDTLVEPSTLLSNSLVNSTIVYTTKNSPEPTAMNTTIKLKIPTKSTNTEVPSESTVEGLEPVSINVNTKKENITNTELLTPEFQLTLSTKSISGKIPETSIYTKNEPNASSENDNLTESSVSFSTKSNKSQELTHKETYKLTSSLLFSKILKSSSINLKENTEHATTESLSYPITNTESAGIGTNVSGKILKASSLTENENFATTQTHVDYVSLVNTLLLPEQAPLPTPQKLCTTTSGNVHKCTYHSMTVAGTRNFSAKQEKNIQHLTPANHTTLEITTESFPVFTNYTSDNLKPENFTVNGLINKTFSHKITEFVDNMTKNEYLTTPKIDQESTYKNILFPEQAPSPISQISPIVPNQLEEECTNTPYYVSPLEVQTDITTKEIAQKTNTDSTWYDYQLNSTMFKDMKTTEKSNDNITNIETITIYSPTAYKFNEGVSAIATSGMLSLQTTTAVKEITKNGFQNPDIQGNTDTHTTVKPLTNLYTENATIHLNNISEKEVGIARTVDSKQHSVTNPLLFKNISEFNSATPIGNAEQVLTINQTVSEFTIDNTTTAYYELRDYVKPTYFTENFLATEMLMNETLEHAGNTLVLPEQQPLPTPQTLPRTSLENMMENVQKNFAYSVPNQENRVSSLTETAMYLTSPLGITPTAFSYAEGVTEFTSLSTTTEAEHETNYLITTEEEFTALRNKTNTETNSYTTFDSKLNNNVRYENVTHISKTEETVEMLYNENYKTTDHEILTQLSESTSTKPKNDMENIITSNYPYIDLSTLESVGASHMSNETLKSSIVPEDFLATGTQEYKPSHFGLVSVTENKTISPDTEYFHEISSKNGYLLPEQKALPTPEQLYMKKQQNRNNSHSLSNSRTLTTKPIENMGTNKFNSLLNFYTTAILSPNPTVESTQNEDIIKLDTGIVGSFIPSSSSLNEVGFTSEFPKTMSIAEGEKFTNINVESSEIHSSSNFYFPGTRNNVSTTNVTNSEYGSISSFKKNDTATETSYNNHFTIEGPILFTEVSNFSTTKLIQSKDELSSDNNLHAEVTTERNLSFIYDSNHTLEPINLSEDFSEGKNPKSSTYDENFLLTKQESLSAAPIPFKTTEKNLIGETQESTFTIRSILQDQISTAITSGFPSSNGNTELLNFNMDKNKIGQETKSFLESTTTSFEMVFPKIYSINEETPVSSPHSNISNTKEEVTGNSMNITEEKGTLSSESTNSITNSETNIFKNYTDMLSNITNFTNEISENNNNYENYNLSHAIELGTTNAMQELSDKNLVITHQSTDLLNSHLMSLNETPTLETTANAINRTAQYKSVSESSADGDLLSSTKTIIFPEQAPIPTAQELYTVSKNLGRQKSTVTSTLMPEYESTTIKTPTATEADTTADRWSDSTIIPMLHKKTFPPDENISVDETPTNLTISPTFSAKDITEFISVNSKYVTEHSLTNLSMNEEKHTNVEFQSEIQTKSSNPIIMEPEMTTNPTVQTEVTKNGMNIIEEEETYFTNTYQTTGSLDQENYRTTPASDQLKFSIEETDNYIKMPSSIMHSSKTPVITEISVQTAFHPDDKLHSDHLTDNVLVTETFIPTQYTDNITENINVIGTSLEDQTNSVKYFIFPEQAPLSTGQIIHFTKSNNEIRKLQENASVSSSLGYQTDANIDKSDLNITASNMWLRTTTKLEQGSSLTSENGKTKTTEAESIEIFFPLKSSSAKPKNDMEDMPSKNRSFAELSNESVVAYQSGDNTNLQHLTNNILVNKTFIPKSELNNGNLTENKSVIPVSFHFEHVSPSPNILLSNHATLSTSRKPKTTIKKFEDNVQERTHFLPSSTEHPSVINPNFNSNISQLNSTINAVTFQENESILESTKNKNPILMGKTAVNITIPSTTSFSENVPEFESLYLSTVLHSISTDITKTEDTINHNVDSENTKHSIDLAAAIPKTETNLYTTNKSQILLKHSSTDENRDNFNDNGKTVDKLFNQPVTEKSNTYPNHIHQLKTSELKELHTTKTVYEKQVSKSVTTAMYEEGDYDNSMSMGFMTTTEPTPIVCVCNLKKALHDLIILHNRILRQINYKCSKKICSSGGIEFIYTSKPHKKGRYKVHKYHVTDYNVPLDEKQIKEMMNSAADVNPFDGKMYALPLIKVSIPCLSPEEKYDISTSEITFNWYRADNNPMPLHRVVDTTSESLTLKYALVEDSGNYTCAATFRDKNSGIEITRHYTYELNVVALPLYSIRGIAHTLILGNCFYIDIDTLPRMLSPQLKRKLCGKSNLCHVTVIEPTCHSEEGAWPTLSFKFIIRIPGLVNQLYQIQESQCGLPCKKIIELKMLILLSENMYSAFNVQDFYHSSYRYEVGCLGGYFLDDGLCIPCPAGTFSPEGAVRCRKCRDGYYQPKRAGEYCIPCPHPFAGGTCMKLFSQAYQKTALIVGFIFLLAVAGIFCSCCARKKGKDVSEA